MAEDRQDLVERTADDLWEPVSKGDCAREPIHLPGSVQPHGVLLSMRQEDLAICQVSVNVRGLLGLEPRACLGRPLAAVLGHASADTIERHIQSFTDLRERNPLHLEIPAGHGRVRQVDAVLHRAASSDHGQGRLLVELELTDGPRPFSFPNTYQAVRAGVAEMTAALTLGALFTTTVRRVRALTGFDRVMIYRFDIDHNGEVVAEDRRPGLGTFLGLHFPASDIPAQARALYEKNWLRVIPDVGYEPVPLLPGRDPESGLPLDLTYSVLRSVSPAHVQYLRNMGVRASMSISLMRDGRLWGLIACHHYSGPHLPPVGVRAAAEFLGTTLSLRLVDRADDESREAVVRAERELAAVASRLADEDRTLAVALAQDTFRRDVVPADVVAVLADGRLETSGEVVPPAAVNVVQEWARQMSNFEPVWTDHVAQDLPQLSRVAPGIAGVLAVGLPGSGVVAWFRHEKLRTIDWGGDPRSVGTPRAQARDVAVPPRESFDRWRETVRDRSEPWTPDQVRLAGRLRGLLVEAMYSREKSRARAAEVLQRSLLPDALPEISGWRLSAWYRPAPGGRVGGDWYDAVLLPDGRVSVVVGDVAGHGLHAAGVMARFSNTLRAFLLRGDTPVAAIRAMDAIVAASYPEQMATLSVATLAPDGAEVEIVSMGHLPPVHVSPAGVVEVAGPQGPPLGIASHVPESYTVRLGEADALVMFSDGVVERRTESLEIGLLRLRQALEVVPVEAGGRLIDMVRDPDSDDDQTLVVIRHRPARASRRRDGRVA